MAQSHDSPEGLVWPVGAASSSDAAGGPLVGGKLLPRPLHSPGKRPSHYRTPRCPDPLYFSKEAKLLPWPHHGIT